MKEGEGEGDIIIKIDKCKIGGDDGEKSRNVSVEKKEKGSGVKKSPKPPRPPGPRGLSLDAADQKLIKEILMIKRARIKAKPLPLRKTNPSSTPNFIAMLFTLLFCLVILFQGTSTTTTTS